MGFRVEGSGIPPISMWEPKGWKGSFGIKVSSSDKTLSGKYQKHKEEIGSGGEKFSRIKSILEHLVLELRAYQHDQVRALLATEHYFEMYRGRE